MHKTVQWVHIEFKVWNIWRHKGHFSPKTVLPVLEPWARSTGLLLKSLKAQLSLLK